MALGAGMLAALNPCGFALLPGYLALLVTGDDPSRPVAVGRALGMTAAMTAGFTVVFAVFGLVLAPTAASVQRYLPWLTLVIGILVAAAGGWLLAGRALPAPRALRRKPGGSPTGSPGAMVGYGVSYALASLTCTVGPFLAVVVAAFRVDSVGLGLLLFGLYAAGMGLVVGTAALGVALTQQSLVHRFRSMSRYVPAGAGLLLLLVGGYVSYYAWWEIRSAGGTPTQDPVIEAALSLQRSLAATVGWLGPAAFATAVGLALLAVGASTWAARRRRRHRTERTPG